MPSLKFSENGFSTLINVHERFLSCQYVVGALDDYFQLAGLTVEFVNEHAVVIYFVFKTWYVTGHVGMKCHLLSFVVSTDSGTPPTK